MFASTKTDKFPGISRCSKNTVLFKACGCRVQPGFNSKNVEISPERQLESSAEREKPGL